MSFSVHDSILLWMSMTMTLILSFDPKISIRFQCMTIPRSHTASVIPPGMFTYPNVQQHFSSFCLKVTRKILRRVLLGVTSVLNFIIYVYAILLQGSLWLHNYTLSLRDRELCFGCWNCKAEICVFPCKALLFEKRKHFLNANILLVINGVCHASQWI